MDNRFLTRSLQGMVSLRLSKPSILFHPNPIKCLASKTDAIFCHFPPFYSFPPHPTHPSSGPNHFYPSNSITFRRLSSSPRSCGLKRDTSRLERCHELSTNKKGSLPSNTSNMAAMKVFVFPELSPLEKLSAWSSGQFI